MVSTKARLGKDMFRVGRALRGRVLRISKFVKLIVSFCAPEEMWIQYWKDEAKAIGR